MNKGIRKDRLVVLLLAFIALGGYFYYKNTPPARSTRPSEVLTSSSHKITNPQLDGIKARIEGLNNMEQVLEFNQITIERDLDLDSAVL